MGFPYKNICIQLIPVLRTAHETKILLVKWRAGPYKGRYTGMMKITHYEADFPPTKKFLGDIAATLIPAKSNLTLNSTRSANGVELVGLLSFLDPPAYDEYVFLGDVNAVSYFSSLYSESPNPGLFGNNQCIWCDIDNIPYHEMPEDDALWYPKVLQYPPRKVIGSFRFKGPQMRRLDKYILSEIEEFRWVGDGTGFFYNK